MGRDFDQKHSLWKYAGLKPPAIGQPKTNPMLFPFPVNRNSLDPVFPRSGSVPLDGFVPQYNCAMHPINVGSEQKRFFIFDQSGDQTSLIYSSVVGPPLWNPDPFNAKASEIGSFGTGFNHNGDQIVRSNNTILFDSHTTEQIHEDTEELDALLYSESYENHEQDEDEVSTGHSPLDITGTPDEIATPTKKRRLDRDLDASLVDTASSARPQNLSYNNDESSCVKDRGEGSKRLKRKRIQETVGVLRRIIPGGKGKDAAAVLDSAIRYLRSLKLRVKELGASL